MSEINVLSKEELKTVSNITVPYAFDIKKLNKDDKTYAKAMLAIGMGSIFKEKTILDFLEYEDDTALHGFDGVEKSTKKPVEIKTETFSGHGKTISKCSGTMNFGDNKESAYEKFLEQNPIMSVASFTPYGKVIAVIEFNFNDSNLKENVITYLEKRKKDIEEGKNKNTNLSKNYKTFENAKSFRVRYYNNKYGDLLVGPYRKLIENSLENEYKKMSKESIIKMFSNLSKQDKMYILTKNKFKNKLDKALVA